MSTFPVYKFWIHMCHDAACFNPSMAHTGASEPHSAAIQSSQAERRTCCEKSSICEAIGCEQDGASACGSATPHHTHALSSGCHIHATLPLQLGLSTHGPTLWYCPLLTLAFSHTEVRRARIGCASPRCASRRRRRACCARGSECGARGWCERAAAWTTPQRPPAGE